MKITATLILIAFNFLAIGQNTATFDIRYSVKPDFSISGAEEDNLSVLANNRLVIVRHEADSVYGVEHRLRIWCTDSIGTTYWDHLLDIGTGDSVHMHSSLSVSGNTIYLAYPLVEGNKQAHIEIMQLDEDGNVAFNKAVEMNNHYSEFFPQVLVYEDSLLLGLTTVDQNLDTTLVFARAPLSNLSVLAIRKSQNPDRCRELLLAENNTVFCLSTGPHASMYFAINNLPVQHATIFPAEMGVFNVIRDQQVNYFVGMDQDGIVFKTTDNQELLWAKKLNVFGPPYHGSSATGLVVSDAKIYTLGYESIPVPVTYLSEFNLDGTPVQHRKFSDFHSFNYNFGELMKANNSLYFSKLGGVFTGTMFITTLNRIDPNTLNSCGTSNYNYVYIDTTFSLDTTSFSLTPETAQTSNASYTFLQDSLITEIACFPELGLEETALAVTVAPNPFLRSFLVTDTQADQLMLTDALGQQVEFNYTVLSDNQLEIIPENAASSLLFLTILRNDGQKQTIRLIQLH